jgi:putative endopeptidase
MPLRNAMTSLLLGALLATPALGADAPAIEPAIQRIPGFNTTAMDRSVDPCQDFYQFACGNWVKSNPIPPDQSTWSNFNKLSQNNQAILRGILEKAAVESPGRSAVEQKIGDYYASCLDQAAIESRGTAPLREPLGWIAGLKDKAGLADVLPRLQEVGVTALFMFSAAPDVKDSTHMIAGVNQGGLGMPSRDYYLNDDARSVEIRAKYVAHLQKMLELLGDAPEQAAAEAKGVLALETALARASLSPVERREPTRTYHPMTVAQLGALAPSFAWDRYLAATGAPRFEKLNVAVPAFFSELDNQIKSTPLDVFQAYLRVHLARAEAPMLPAAFATEEFNFSNRTLSGVQEMQPRWKRCVEYADQQLGEALGQKYVEVAFGDENRRRTEEMINALLRALGENIRTLDWMSEQTKKQALEKLARITPKIGNPKVWRDYGSLAITRGDALGNWERARTFERHRQLGKIGKALDKSEWSRTPPTVNAYYNPNENDINFPAGILQPPFFDVAIDDAINFGAIGVVIGHELTHGFDDHGRKFDAAGNLRDWWTEQDGKEFERRASCLADQYSGYTAVGDVKLNGRLTLGENTADQGGVRIAYMALHDLLGGKEPPKVDGFTADQRFFLGFAQTWCENRTPETLRRMALTNPHSPGRYRVVGVVTNSQQFRQAFGCPAGQPMAPEKVCRVW